MQGETAMEGNRIGRRHKSGRACKMHRQVLKQIPGGIRFEREPVKQPVQPPTAFVVQLGESALDIIQLKNSADASFRHRHARVRNTNSLRLLENA
jgi:hypothetical protein